MMVHCCGSVLGSSTVGERWLAGWLLGEEIAVRVRVRDSRITALLCCGMVGQHGHSKQPIQ
jgi:hypothetical protein